MENLIPEIVTAVVVPLVGAAVVAVRSWLKATLTPQRLHAIAQLARTAVDAAEEVGRAVEDVTGPEKYRYAEAVLRQGAERVGVKLTNEEANTFIHAAIHGKRSEVDDAVNAVLADIFAQASLVDSEEGGEVE